MKLQVLKSQIDQSVNFVEEQLAGFLEARYVRRCDDYFIAYLSSHSGCKLGCQMCHLTVTNQTSFIHSTENDFLAQAIQVFKHYRREKVKAKWCSFNWMARGEPLANNTLLSSGDQLLIKLGQVAKDEGLPAKFNISTIMPMTFKQSLVDTFRFVSPTMYYSLYSMDPAFRKKWMPAAMEPNKALSLLKEYQDFSKKIVKIHFPYIAGENDSEQSVHEMCDAIDRAGLVCEFNLVRYNPATPAQGVEGSLEVLDRNLNILKERFRFDGKVKMIKKIGQDVMASCGTFFNQLED